MCIEITTFTCATYIFYPFIMYSIVYLFFFINTSQSSGNSSLSLCFFLINQSTPASRINLYLFISFIFIQFNADSYIFPLNSCFLVLRVFHHALIFSLTKTTIHPFLPPCIPPAGRPLPPPFITVVLLIR